MPRSSPSACATSCCRRCPRRLRRAPAWPLLRATSSFPAGCGRARGYGGRVRRRRWSTILLPAGLLPAGRRVELGDQRVPGGCGALKLGPKALRAPPFERSERHTLLLDPGVIPEVEDARALDVGQFEHVIVGDAEQMLAEHLTRTHRVEAIGVMC